MATCRTCGAEIEFITTADGKPMPCDPREFPLIPDRHGTVTGVMADGVVIKGRTCSESYEDEAWVYARISHFATCPQAAEHRKR